MSFVTVSVAEYVDLLPYCAVGAEVGQGGPFDFGWPLHFYSPPDSSLFRYCFSNKLSFYNNILRAVRCCFSMKLSFTKYI